MIKIIDCSKWKGVNNESDVNNKLIKKYLEYRKFKSERIEARNSNGQGIPDWVIEWKKRFIFVEVKYKNNKLLPRQRQWFAKYDRNCFLVKYDEQKIFIYDSKQILILIKEGKL